LIGGFVMTSISAMGIPWYSPDDYPAIRKVMADGDNFPKLFAEWKVRAEAVERQLNARCALVVRAMITPEQFRIWCNIRAIKCDSSSRGRFANEKARDALKAAGQMRERQV
jgi:hypothetical protein